MDELLYKIGISLIPSIGDVRAKKLIAYCGGVKEVFQTKKRDLLKIAEIGEYTAKEVVSQSVLVRAEQEIKFIEKNKINAVFYLDEAYPVRLKYCDDSPIMLYTTGELDLKVEKIVSIVGTRNATEYGRNMCEKIVDQLAIHKPLILSGLAYGIDITAHKQAVKNNLQTVGVLAHGLDKLYPAEHKNTADKMKLNGGLVTEHLSEVTAAPENFPKRNRIVAGMADAVIVVEAGIKGGALITAELANGYNRDVFAVPGKLGDTYSEGCNRLIKINKAALFESVADLEYLLGWKKADKKPPILQKQLFVELNETEEIIVKLLGNSKSIHIDELSFQSKLSNGQLSGALLSLEFKGLVKSMPGRVFQLC